jgi:lipopolysaccharide export system permease protein
MISRLDRYVARYFLSSWFVSAVFFVGLYGIYDVFAHVDDLIEGLDETEMGALDVLRMYALQLPGIFVQVSPFVMVLAALVTALRLQRHNEFMAMVLTGRSARRVLLPVYALSLMFIGGLVYVQESLVPAVALERDELRWALLEDKGERVIESIKLRDSQDRLFVAHDYHVKSGTVGRLNVSYHDEQGRNRHVTGENATWDESGSGWKFENGHSEVRSGVGGESRIDETFFVQTDIRPEELLAESREPFDLAYRDVLGLSERYPSSRRYRLLMHYHVTFPLSVLLLVLLALPFVVRFEADRRLKGLGISILMCLGFLIADASLRDIGSRGDMQPVLAAWLPVIVAGSLATVLFDAMDG